MCASKAAGFDEFEKFDCWIWDCYKPRMWRIDDSGIRRWKRKVPFADAPVQPFIVGDYIVYVGGYTSVSELTILDVDTGKLVESFAPEGEKRGFWTPRSSFPFLLPRRLHLPQGDQRNPS